MLAKVREITVSLPKADKFVINRDVDEQSAASIDDVERKTANRS